MSKTRPTTDEDRAEIKAATRDSLRKVRANKFALVTRYEESELSKFGSMAEADRFMPADVIADLQLEFPRGVASPLLETLAAIAGLKLVPLDDEPDGDSVEIGDVDRVMKEDGEAKSAALKAIGATDLSIVRTAKKEAIEARDAYGRLVRTLTGQKRRLLARAV
ncbi:hypothetical protein EOD08_24245 [Mesorhizobium sp. M6A.T.Ca.TU.002.02.2.1]|nr:hypothetical protein EOD08_24245 [Mesorhizobium sp. M6A.T.Ca.TU.002.02.2.1]